MAEHASRGNQLPDYVGLVYALVLVWGLGDVLSTFAAHAATGAVNGELNPLVSSLLDSDPLLVVALKAGVVLCVGLVLLVYRDRVLTVPGWRVWMSAIVGLGVIVVANNLVVAIMA